MLSTAGTIDHACPSCKSGNITRGQMFGQNSYICRACNTWGPWRNRLRVDVKKRPLPPRQRSGI